MRWGDRISSGAGITQVAARFLTGKAPGLSCFTHPPAVAHD